MNGEIVTPAEAGSGAAGSGDEVPPAATDHRRSRRPWLIALLVACALVVGGVAGGIIQHATAQANASRDLYRAQVLTTIYRFNNEEKQLIALPAAKRDITALADLADAITADPGVNDSGMLRVTLGAGSAAQPGQIIFTVYVASPHGTSAFAVWYLTPQGPSSSDAGACVLWSTLLGSGRAATGLNLGESTGVQACQSQWWSPSTNPDLPHFGLAGIPSAPGGFAVG